MKYKVGDKFVAKSESCTFSKGEIIAITEDPYTPYILRVNDVSDGYTPLLEHGELTLESFYKLSSKFFKVGMVYRYRFSTNLYTIIDVYENENPVEEQVALQALAGMESPEGDHMYTLLHAGDFSKMEEVE